MSIARKQSSVRNAVAALALLQTFVTGAAQAAAERQPDTCFAGWSDAVPVVQREALTSVSELHNRARALKLGDVVRITLCSDQGRFIYRLLVREPLGHVVPMVVDARHPFEQ